VGHVTLSGVRLAIGERTLFERLDLDVGEGEFLAIVGPNGIGKTTLLRAMAGFAPIAAGAVRYSGIDLGALSRTDRAYTVTVIESDAEAPHAMTVGEVVMTGRYAHRDWWDWLNSDADILGTQMALDKVGLGDLARRQFDTLSSGERQRAWIALALAQDATVFLLDEPTSHLDARYALEMLGLLRTLAGKSRSIVAVLHDLNEAAAFADRIAVFGEGQLLTCAPPESALDPDILERAFGVRFKRIAVDGGIRVLAY
jgi:iron complex transport system ATP-binding protein